MLRVKYILLILILISSTSEVIAKRNLNVKRFLKYSIKYESIIKEASIKYDMDTLLIQGHISWESNWDKDAVSPKNCKGLTQVNNGSTDPRKSIMSGCAILRRLYDKYGNWLTALSAYNLGERGLRRTKKQYTSYALNIVRMQWQIMNVRKFGNIRGIQK